MRSSRNKGVGSSRTGTSPKVRTGKAERRGWLKNGNQPGNPQVAVRCGAKTRCGSACQGPAMPNGRCRLHGGKSSGPRTAIGLERCRRANWKHGRYSQQARAERERLLSIKRSIWARATQQALIKVVGIETDQV